MDMDENREYEQQQFIESVVASLHRATEEDGPEYVRKFSMIIALCLIEATREKDIVQIRGSFPAVRDMFEKWVLFDVYAFGKDWVEQQLIFGKIAKKLLDDSVMPSL